MPVAILAFTLFIALIANLAMIIHILSAPESLREMRAALVKTNDELNAVRKVRDRLLIERGPTADAPWVVTKTTSTPAKPARAKTVRAKKAK